MLQFPLHRHEACGHCGALVLALLRPVGQHSQRMSTGNPMRKGRSHLKMENLEEDHLFIHFSFNLDICFAFLQQRYLLRFVRSQNCNTPLKLAIDQHQLYSCQLFDLTTQWFASCHYTCSKYSQPLYPLVMTNIATENGPVEIVSFPSFSHE